MATSALKRESFWRHLIAQRKSLKLTVDAVCERAGVSRASFYHWQQRLRQSKRMKPPASSSLMPVQIVDDRINEITLELPNGIRVRVPQGCDEATLQGVLRAVLATRGEALC